MKLGVFIMLKEDIENEFKKLQNNAAKQRIDYQTALVRAIARFDGIKFN